MRIVVDCRLYSVQAGIGRYIRNLIFNLQKIDKKNTYFILLLKKDYDLLVNQRNFVRVVADFQWYGITEQLKLPKLLHKLNPDLVHFPHFNLPILYRGKFVVTIHDLTHKYFAMKRATTHGRLIYFLKQIGYKVVFKKAATESGTIITPSHYIKNLIAKEYSIPEEKMVVTYEAVDHKFISISENIKKGEIENVMKKFSVSLPYLFYVGNAHPHKNVEGLIKAFFKLKEKYQNLKLVLSGPDHYFWQRLKKEYQLSEIVYTGYVTDEEMVALYKNASSFVMPSFEEGFGIPLLEAMASFAPVVSSNAGALPEVGGDAALYFDPRNTNDMADKISQVLDSEKLKEELIDKGQKRVKFFSWEKLAKQTLEVYRKETIL
ncbi:glycosyltransferase family 4 protein [Candidatus Daviesbacteria bacterium]|nr:glycosyltransferase family 4 protein [Candidatus Daviesbacteria bacterium]